jgi:AhpC/TSA family./Copper type II ascorbate-dependent monooxygenase, C-terminal domain.
VDRRSPSLTRRCRAFVLFTVPFALTTTLLLAALGVNAALPAATSRQKSAASAGDAAPTAPITWQDVSGRRYGAADIAAAKATVFFFSSTECPIAQKYVGRFRAFEREFAPKGVRFFLVNSGPGGSAAAWKKYAAERKIPFPAVRDNGTALADRLNATMTPEAVIVDAAGEIRYIGRIDDSPDAARVSRSEAREALEAVLTGRPVKVTRARALGCAIFRESVETATRPKVAAKVTYTRDIAPILNDNCVVCHRAGDVAPFTLDTYAQAKVWASAIKEYTARRLMPPFKADPAEGGPFHDTRWLTDAQIAKIAAWADSGAPQGDKKDLPPPPKLHAAGDWPLGRPDMVLKPVRPFHLEAEGEDVYRNFTLPVDFEKDTYVKVMDFRPGNRAIVHHIIAYIDPTGETAQARDNKEAEPGWSVSGGGSGIKNDEWGEGWAPGMSPRLLPPGVAVKIPKGAKLVMQVHYHKSGKPEVDQSEVALYLAKEPIREVLRTFPLGNPIFALKPGVAGQEVKAAMVLPYPVKLYQTLPHMHMLGKTMRVTATLPDGTKRPLISIRDWDFNWQMAYRYVEPIRLPKGTRLDLVATYDNTASNPNQPSNPPKLVTFGEQTTDEMCFAFLGLTRDTEAEAAAATTAAARMPSASR